MEEVRHCFMTTSLFLSFHTYMASYTYEYTMNNDYICTFNMLFHCISLSHTQTLNYYTP